MTTETPLDWVLLEAEKRCEWEFSIEKLRFEYHHEDSTCFRALCDMIAKHEKPPVCRKVLCAREAMKSWIGGGAGPETICVRAIELWEEGFGK
jgi:hypothetical protein